MVGTDYGRQCEFLLNNVKRELGFTHFESIIRRLSASSAFAEWSLVVLLVVLGTVLRLPNLGESLWLDEVIYSTNYIFSSLSDLWYYFLHEPSAPLYRTFMFFWVHMFGEHELSVRMPPLVFGLSSIVLTYWIAATYGSRRMALLAAVLLCFSPVHVWYSQEATPYAMTLCFLLATIWAWLQLKATPSHQGWYAVYLSMFLVTVFTHYYAAVFLLSFTLLSLAAGQPLRRRLMVAQGVVLSCLVCALSTKYLLGDYGLAGAPFLRRFTLFEWWMLFFNWFLHGNALWTVTPYRMAAMGVTYLWREPLLLLCQIGFLAIFLRGLGPTRGRKRWTQTWELGLFLVTLPVVMLVLTQAGYSHLYIERYLVLLLPFFLIVMARGVASFANTRMVIACAIMVLSVGAASYGALLYKDDTWTVYKPNPDWRSASRYLTTESGGANKADIVVVQPSDDLKYYLHRVAPGAPPKVINYDPRTFLRVLSGDGVRAFHLVKNEYAAGGFDAVLQGLKHDQRFLLANTHAFKGVEVYTFRFQ